MGLHVRDGREELVDDLAATLAADVLDLLQLDIRRLIRLLLSLLVAAGVLWLGENCQRLAHLAVRSASAASKQVVIGPYLLLKGLELLFLLLPVLLDLLLGLAAGVLYALGAVCGMWSDEVPSTGGHRERRWGSGAAVHSLAGGC